MKILRIVLLAAVFSLVAGANADEIEDFCEADFGTDNSSYTRCVNEQNEAKAILANYTGPSRQYCQSLWDPDAVETLNCYQEQIEAMEFLESIPGSDKLTQCRSQGGEDYVVIASCVDANWEEAMSTLSPGPLNGPAQPSTEPAAPQPQPSMVVWRYVENLKGPYQLTNITAEHVITVTNQKETRQVQLAFVVLAPSGATYISTRLTDREVWLEQTRHGLYIYVQNSAGEWGDRNMQFEQLNLALARNGLASLRADAVDERYAHFFDAAVLQAKHEKLGLWASR